MGAAMMTFRSFSRFVRWYRWGILATGAAAAHCVYMDDRYMFAVSGGIWAITVFFASLPGILKSSRCERRLDARKKRAHVAELARVRTMPLRGWTK